MLPFLFWICTLVGIVIGPLVGKNHLRVVSGHAIGVMLLIGHYALHCMLFLIRV